jgi:hypothetical protein
VNDNVLYDRESLSQFIGHYRGRLKKKNELALRASKIFEQLAPSKLHWPEKYRSTKWTDIKGGICHPPPPKKHESKDRAI